MIGRPRPRPPLGHHPVEPAPADAEAAGVSAATRRRGTAPGSLGGAAAGRPTPPAGPRPWTQCRGPRRAGVAAGRSSRPAARAPFSRAASLPGLAARSRVPRRQSPWRRGARRGLPLRSPRRCPGRAWSWHRHRVSATALAPPDPPRRKPRGRWGDPRRGTGRSEPHAPGCSLGASRFRARDSNAARRASNAARKAAPLAVAATGAEVPPSARAPPRAAGRPGPARMD